VSTAKVNRSGYRYDDCAVLHRIYNRVMAEVASIEPEDDKATLRRLRVLSDWISASANAAFEDDPFAAGMADADQFWRDREATIRRSKGEDA